MNPILNTILFCFVLLCFVLFCFMRVFGVLSVLDVLDVLDVFSVCFVNLDAVCSFDVIDVCVCYCLVANKRGRTQSVVFNTLVKSGSPY